MQLDPNNHVVKLCAEGMNQEGTSEEASKLFLEAWDEASTNLEKAIAAHYVARHQTNVELRLKWDQIALSSALKIDDNEVRALFPSLYLNVAKCHEDLNDIVEAIRNYELAFTFVGFLQNDGYGNVIRGGILNGLKRVKVF